jgi:hypothetical protein
MAPPLQQIWSWVRESERSGLMLFAFLKFRNHAMPTVMTVSILVFITITEITGLK